MVVLLIIAYILMGTGTAVLYGIEETNNWRGSSEYLIDIEPLEALLFVIYGITWPVTIFVYIGIKMEDWFGSFEIPQITIFKRRK